MNFDIIVVGAGPAGLCFARSMAASGQRIVLVDGQPETALAEPLDDGREIAITHHSQRRMRELGLWQHLRDGEVATLRDAKVMDGSPESALLFRHDHTDKQQLGWFVSNHAIRRAAWKEASTLEDVRILTATRTTAVDVHSDGVHVSLDNGDTLSAGLLVAADSRFSGTRRALGITADLHDFGKTMLVLRMRHTVSHDQTAWEWFGHGQTLALLSLHDPHTSSVVLTLPPHEMEALLARDDEAVAREMAQRFQHTLGQMEVAGPRCSYPLVGTWANRFVGTRCALIGDAAVGMHPVTAHGFNFGLLGQATLAEELRHALARGRPAWDQHALRRYQRRHRLATRPLYLATEMIAELYSDDRPHARVLRKAALGAARRAGPFKRLVMSGLVSEQGSLPAPLRRLWRRSPAMPM